MPHSSIIKATNESNSRRYLLRFKKSTHDSKSGRDGSLTPYTYLPLLPTTRTLNRKKLTTSPTLGLFFNLSKLGLQERVSSTRSEADIFGSNMCSRLSPASSVQVRALDAYVPMYLNSLASVEFSRL